MQTVATATAFELGLRVGMAKMAYLTVTGDNERAELYDQVGALFAEGRFKAANDLLNTLSVEFDVACALTDD